MCEIRRANASYFPLMSQVKECTQIIHLMLNQRYLRDLMISENLREKFGCIGLVKFNVA